MFILKSPHVVPLWLAVGILGFVHALEASCLEVFVMFIRPFAHMME